ncbi:hypothetical protein L1987_01595 [Smallanthus sonchifolius]|uniref:Uncharacterized protein n=1 Tax=Smallanthus sonchifolius TaxID=185202 RepID=A0ACB9K5L2_9ASTR|nr:hypothetical protein L1987_01595 [Smallanthus sonchifolius]
MANDATICQWLPSPHVVDHSWDIPEVERHHVYLGFGVVPYRIGMEPNERLALHGLEKGGLRFDGVDFTLLKSLGCWKKDRLSSFRNSPNPHYAMIGDLGSCRTRNLGLSTVECFLYKVAERKHVADLQAQHAKFAVKMDDHVR